METNPPPGSLAPLAEPTSPSRGEVGVVADSRS